MDVGEAAISLAIALVAALAGVGVKWLWNADNRHSLRQRLCRHEWEARPGAAINTTTAFAVYPPQPDMCRKCGATRRGA